MIIADQEDALSEIVKRAVQTGVRRALKDQSRAHNPTSSTRSSIINDDVNYNDRSETLSGSGSDTGSDADRMEMKRKGNMQSKSRTQTGRNRSRNDIKFDDGKGGVKEREEENKMKNMKKRKSNLRGGGKFAADFTGPTGLLHARGHGQGTDKITCYAGGKFAWYLRAIF